MRIRMHNIAAAFVAAGALVGCARRSAPVSHENLTSIDALRSAFDADSGKVRAIFLASPT